jgi:hypothetical protein
MLGNIVHLRRSQGLIKDAEVITSDVGLVIKEHKEKGAVPQYQIKWTKKEKPLWYYAHQLSFL